MFVWSMVSSYTLVPTRLTGPFVTFNIKHKPLITVQLTSNHKWHVVEQYVVSTPTEKNMLKEAQKWCSGFIAFQ